ncbi:hypothetical protein RHMOL_Rhmol01G0057200 [Rhododendron molle]|uniref:Uncharacterized protein n=1 Tax=Rhododendron molle TaxID=49168 RepID=A0ACC0PZW9_RHOML|nr:hypothetical protein RHMOL_Rhmol01G0057200 [Rhododendron molle]
MAQKLKNKVLVVAHKICYMLKTINVDFRCGTECYNLPNFIASHPREGLSTIITNTNQANNQIKPNSKAHMVVYIDSFDTTYNAPSKPLAQYLDFDPQATPHGPKA